MLQAIPKLITKLYDAVNNGTGATVITNRRSDMPARAYCLWQLATPPSRITITIEGRNLESGSFTALATATENDFTLGRAGGTCTMECIPLMQEMRAVIADTESGDIIKVYLDV